MRKLDPEFTFAGFAFPKYLWTLPRPDDDLFPVGKLTHDQVHARLERQRNPVTGGYYHAPKPNNNGWGVYDIPMRWAWCDEISTSIRHTGWFCDEHGDSKIRGLVITLPNRRGFLAGWSMGKGMAGCIEPEIFDDRVEAAAAADDEAERAAERQREYEHNENRRICQEEAAVLDQARAEEQAQREVFEKRFVPGAYDIWERHKKVMADAAAVGLVITSETVPLQPLAMGNYKVQSSMRLHRSIYSKRT